MKPHRNHSSDEPDWAGLLHEHGLRATRAVVQVLEILHSADAPLTHEKIHEAYLRLAGEAPDKVTLYRILERLNEAKLCDRSMGADRLTRFAQHSTTSGNVFECSSCHKVQALPEDPDLPAVLARLGKALKRRGIQTHDTAVTLRGTCSDCR
ncbi:Fur family transcriptional regulator [Variovorax sp. GB1P17]|uniref:Fur family transcriptional regulator n=1 Tax=Variovorax sp. GB1P17 TaxID=3443740 RepID=UPI003F46F17F